MHGQKEHKKCLTKFLGQKCKSKSITFNGEEKNKCTNFYLAVQKEKLLNL